MVDRADRDPAIYPRTDPCSDRRFRARASLPAAGGEAYFVAPSGRPAPLPLTFASGKPPFPSFGAAALTATGAQPFLPALSNARTNAPGKARHADLVAGRPRNGRPQ